MKRLVMLLAVWGAASWVLGGPLQSQAPRLNLLARPHTQESYLVSFEAGKPARAMAIGKGNTFLGLYVFDRYGNCVAWDDISRVTRDDLAVEWVPAQAGPYALEVVNMGRSPNKFALIVR